MSDGRHGPNRTTIAGRYSTAPICRTSDEHCLVRRRGVGGDRPSVGSRKESGMILDKCALCDGTGAYWRMGVGIWLCGPCAAVISDQIIATEVGSDAEQPPNSEG